MAPRRALVIGGSRGGLLAAHLLRNAGWDAVVFERNAEDLTGRGAGISTHPQLIDILRRVGIDFDESMGIKVDTVICLDRHGKTYLQTETARTMSSWGRLYRSLRDPLPAESNRLGMSLHRVEQDADGVTAVFADLPANSSFIFQWISPYTTWEEADTWVKGWTNPMSDTYVQIGRASCRERVCLYV